MLVLICFICFLIMIFFLFLVLVFFFVKVFFLVCMWLFGKFELLLGIDKVLRERGIGGIFFLLFSVFLLLIDIILLFLFEWNILFFLDDNFVLCFIEFFDLIDLLY